MKLIIVLTVTIAILFSCKPTSEKKSDFSNYLQLKEKAIASKVKIDTTFLKFRFGMTKNEVKSRLNELESDSTIYYDYDEKYYCYVLNTGRTGTISQVHCKIIPYYYKNVLYSISLLSFKKDNSILGAELASLFMTSLLQDKYGAYNKELFIYFRCI